MRIELHELWDKVARQVIERAFIATEYILELIVHRIRFLFVLRRKVGAGHTESPEEPFECGCVFLVVYDFCEGPNPRISVVATRDEIPVQSIL